MKLCAGLSGGGQPGSGAAAAASGVGEAVRWALGGTPAQVWVGRRWLAQGGQGPIAPPCLPWHRAGLDDEALAGMDPAERKAAKKKAKKKAAKKVGARAHFSMGLGGMRAWQGSARHGRERGPGC